MSVAWPVEGQQPRAVGGFGKARPAGADVPERHHAGVDISTTRGAYIRATEAGVLRGSFGWIADYPARALVVWTDTGRTLIYAPVEPRSWQAAGLAVGARVAAGQRIGQLMPYPHGSDMLHFEVYDAHQPNNTRWRWGTPKPGALRDPASYLSGASSGSPPNTQPGQNLQSDDGGALIAVTLALLVSLRA